VTGTTGSGKSTLVAQLLKRCGAHRVKAGMFGDFNQKDHAGHLSVAMQYQLVVALNDRPGAVVERGPTNNVWWRIINLGLVRPKGKKLRDSVVENMSRIHPAIFQALASCPKIVLVGAKHVLRERMRQRATGSDLWRADAPGYFAAQNLVYGIFAFATNACVLDTTHEDFKNLESVPEDIVRNLHRASLSAVKPSFPEKCYVRGLVGEEECANDDTLAFKVGLFKSEESAKRWHRS